MNRIEIGRAGGKPVFMDLVTLLRTRALIQANSGGGKSWLLRRLAEELFGKVPVWIVDPEGEFPSLREKFGFVLVGKGGETPADARSVELVVHRLLEHGASAVFDLYDLKPQARHHYVRLLCEALMNAPKTLWRNLIFKLDEAHKFAPEKGQGESEASGAVTDLATAGRKRGFCLMAYTQRLSKITKNVTAELLNRMVGMTFEDLDVDSAAAVLSVSKPDREAFKLQIKNLEPGSFFGLGPAISRDRLLLEVGPVQTTHPEPGTTAAAAPPPAPERIRALLPKLADLPKEAEEKAKTEGELRTEIRSLKAQLAQAGKRDLSTNSGNVKQPPFPKVKPVQVKLLDEGVFKRLQGIRKAIVEAAGDAASLLDNSSARLLDAGARVVESNQKALQAIAATKQPVQTSARPGIYVTKFTPKTDGPFRVPPAVSLPRQRCELPSEPRDTTISRPQLKILQALAMFEALGISDVPRTWVAPLADTTHSSSGFEKNCSTLKTGGYLEVGSPGSIRIRAEGRGEVGNQPAPDHELLLQKCFDAISGPQRAILQTLVHVFPQDLPREEIAPRSETTVTSSGFEKNMSTLKTAGMIEISGKGRARAAAWLFPDQVART